MDPNNNQNSPVRPNYSWNLPEIPPYYPQPPQNPQMPPPQYYSQFPQNYSHPSSNFSPYNHPAGFGSAPTFNPYMMPQPNYFPGSFEMPAYGSPAQQRVSQERPGSLLDSSSLPETEEDDDPVDEDASANRQPWVDREDEALISAFMEYSLDPITGTNQKNHAFWGKVEKRYNEIQQENPRRMRRRKLDSIRGRWRRLSQSIAKWVGCYEQANRRRRSGMQEEDVINEAMQIYSSDNKNAKFTFHFQWSKLKDIPRWQAFLKYPETQQPNSSMETNSSGKRPRLEDDFDLNFETLSSVRLEDDYVPETQQEEASNRAPTMTRPEGVKAAKKKKGKKKVVADPVDVEAVERLEQLADRKIEIARLTTFNNLLIMPNRGPIEEAAYQQLAKELGFVKK